MSDTDRSTDGATFELEITEDDDLPVSEAAEYETVDQYLADAAERFATARAVDGREADPVHEERLERAVVLAIAAGRRDPLDLAERFERVQQFELRARTAAKDAAFRNRTAAWASERVAEAVDDHLVVPDEDRGADAVDGIYGVGGEDTTEADPSVDEVPSLVEVRADVREAIEETGVADFEAFAAELRAEADERETARAR